MIMTSSFFCPSTLSSSDLEPLLGNMKSIQHDFMGTLESR